jgi:hypothetical protein
MSNKESYKIYFDDYVKSVFQIEVDIRFWKQFLAMSIDRYKADNPVNRWISQSGFSFYNFSPDGKSIWLHTSDTTFTIEIDDLTDHSANFFSWIMNVSLVRMYNAVEILLLRAIRQKHFPNLADPIKGKKETNKVIAEIKNHLKNNNRDIDAKNNRYFISFLRNSSADIESFLINGVNSANWKTSWKNFYELFSVLRNIITHHGMIVEQNVRNEINSIAGDIFNFYFQQPDAKKGTDVLAVKDHDLFLNFTSHINDFSGNMIKFIAGENDLKFIGLYPA